MSIDGWIDKYDMYKQCNIIQASNRYSETCYNMNEPWGYYAKWNKSDTEGQILYDPTYLRYLEQSDLHRQKEWWLSGAEVGEKGKLLFKFTLGRVGWTTEMLLKSLNYTLKTIPFMVYKNKKKSPGTKCMYIWKTDRCKGKQWRLLHPQQNTCSISSSGRKTGERKEVWIGNKTWRLISCVCLWKKQLLVTLGDTSHIFSQYMETFLQLSCPSPPFQTLSPQCLQLHSSCQICRC